MVRKEGGKGKMAVNRTSTGNLQIFSQHFSSRVSGHRQQYKGGNGSVVVGGDQ